MDVGYHSRLEAAHPTSVGGKQETIMTMNTTEMITNYVCIYTDSYYIIMYLGMLPPAL